MLSFLDAKLAEKYVALCTHIADKGRVALAFSGGVDSAFLLYAASQALGDKLMALTIRTSYMPEREIQEATEICEQLAVRHQIIDMPVPEQIRNNPADRCYLCKSA